MENIQFKTAFDVVKNLDLSGKVFLVTGGKKEQGISQRFKIFISRIFSILSKRERISLEY